MDNSNKEQVKQDIKRYENQKKIKRLALLGTLGGLGTMTVGGFRKNPVLSGAGALTTAGSALLAGHAKKEQYKALGRIKRHYDLREQKPFINLGAVLPTAESFKKEAAISTLIDAAMHALGSTHGLADYAAMGAAQLGAAAPTISKIHNYLPAAVDISAIPWLASAATKGARGVANIYAKKELGKALNPLEKAWYGGASVAKAIKEKAHKMTIVPTATTLPGKAKRVAQKGLGHSIEYMSQLLGPLSGGSSLGEIAGKALKPVGELSPKYQELGLRAVKSDFAAKRLMAQAKKDAEKITTGLKELQDTRLAKMIERYGKKNAPTAQQFVSGIIEHPERVGEYVKKYKDLEDRVVAGGKMLGIGTAGAITMNAIGQTQWGKKKHPLAKNELPSLIAESQYKSMR